MRRGRKGKAGMGREGLLPRRVPSSPIPSEGASPARAIGATPALLCSPRGALGPWTVSRSRSGRRLQSSSSPSPSPGPRKLGLRLTAAGQRRRPWAFTARSQCSAAWIQRPHAVNPLLSELRVQSLSYQSNGSLSISPQSVDLPSAQSPVQSRSFGTWLLEKTAVLSAACLSRAEPAESGPLRIDSSPTQCSPGPPAPPARPLRRPQLRPREKPPRRCWCRRIVWAQESSCTT